MNYYLYMIGGLIQTRSFYAKTDEQALRIVQTFHEYTEIGDGLRPRRNHLRRWNDDTSRWEWAE